MNYVPAQDIKRRGISAVDDALENGPVHVLKNNRAQYVVLTEDNYRELIEARDELALARIKTSLEDVAAGRVTRHDNADALMKHLDASKE